jgi:activator of 2-hydroxyglutaryl-CoA dehydratase
MLYLGADVGSVSTDIVLIDDNTEVIEKLYLRTRGKPMQAIQEGFGILKEKYDSSKIGAAGTTGERQADCLDPDWCRRR